MRGSHTIELQFHAREVSLQQLPGLWSAVMSVLSEVKHWSGELSLGGESFTHRSVYEGPTALAQSALAFHPHDARHFALNIFCQDFSVEVSKDWAAEYFALLLALPNALRVRVAATSDREVRDIRDAVQRWAGCNLHTQRRALWLKLAALAAGTGATGLGAALMDGGAQAMLLLAAWGGRVSGRLPHAVPDSSGGTPDGALAHRQCARRQGGALSRRRPPRTGAQSRFGRDARAYRRAPGEPAMIRPTKALHLHPAAPGHFLSQTVRFGGTQPAGRWWNLAEHVGLPNGGELDAHALLLLAHGRSPDGERVLADVTPGDGVELVFRAPASVATRWATLQGEGRANVEQCHREAVACSLQATEWRRCAFQAPLHTRFPPMPAHLLGALFLHAHDAPEPDLHTPCLALGSACARTEKTWGPLHRGGFADHVPFGALVYERLLAKALERRLGFTFEPRRTRWARGCRSARRRVAPQPTPCPRVPTARRVLSLVPGTGSPMPPNPDRKERRAFDRFEHHPTPVTASVLARTAPWSAVINEEWGRLQEEQAGAARVAAGCGDEAPAPRLDTRLAAVDAELLAWPPRLLLGALAEIAGPALVVGPLALSRVRHATARIACSAGDAARLEEHFDAWLAALREGGIVHPVTNASLREARHREPVPHASLLDTWERLRGSPMDGDHVRAALAANAALVFTANTSGIDTDRFHAEATEAGCTMPRVPVRDRVLEHFARTLGRSSVALVEAATLPNLPTHPDLRQTMRALAEGLQPTFPDTRRAVLASLRTHTQYLALASRYAPAPTTARLLRADRTCPGLDGFER